MTTPPPVPDPLALIAETRDAIAALGGADVNAAADAAARQARLTKPPELARAARVAERPHRRHPRARRARGSTTG